MCYSREEQDASDQSTTNQTSTSTEQTSRRQTASGLRLHYSKLLHADELYVFMCLTETENEKKKKN